MFRACLFVAMSLTAAGCGSDDETDEFVACLVDGGGIRLTASNTADLPTYRPITVGLAALSGLSYTELRARDRRGTPRRSIVITGLPNRESRPQVTRSDAARRIAELQADPERWGPVVFFPGPEVKTILRCDGESGG